MHGNIHIVLTIPAYLQVALNMGYKYLRLIFLYETIPQNTLAHMMDDIWLSGKEKSENGVN